MVINWEAYRKKAKQLDEEDKKKREKQAQQKKKNNDLPIKPSAQKITDSRDIVPVMKTFVPEKTVTPPTEIAPTVNASKKVEEEQPWYKKIAQKPEAFDDGRQRGEIAATILGTVGDLAMNVASGAGNFLEGIGDSIGYGIADILEAKGNTEYSKKVRDKAKENTVQKILEAPTKAYNEFSVAGDLSDSVAQGLGMVGTMLAGGKVLGTVGLGKGALSAVTTGATALSGYGSGASEAYEGGATDEEAKVYGMISGASEALTEMLFGGLGKGVKALGISKGLSSADDMLAKKVSGMFSNQIAKNLLEYGVKASAEGFEELLAGITQGIGKKITYMSEKELSEILKDEKLFEQAFVGTVTSGFMQGGDLVKANANKTDFITGLNANEQKVVDKEAESRIAEKEKDGKKLDKKEKNKIYDEVVEALDKGYIDTDTIESVLGGETYKTYKDSLDNETALQKEFDTLNKMKQGDMTGEQTDRRAELKQQLEELKNNSKSSQLKNQLSTEVSSLVKDSRLAESYNEKSRRGQAFEADLTKYKGKQLETVKRAVESGILNNTNRTHEFVDMIAKISADKGVLFDFTNNRKLKESGFAIEGKTVNGLVTKDGIKINIHSAKALNSVVGHEVAHVLEGTELYDALKESIFKYAQSKGEYQTRYDEISKLYEGIKDANIENELTADLVGDYLFSDENFIRNLSTENRNVFQKIYDEIKYLCKVATAGSKEARELEKVKRAFEKVYRESEAKINIAEDVKYNLSKNDIYSDMTEQQRFDVLKDKKIQPQEIEVNSKFNDKTINMEFLEKNIKSIVEKPLIKKLKELGYVRKYQTSVIDVDFELTVGGIRKSLNSQAGDYGGNNADFAKIILNLQKLLDNSVLLDVHSDKGKGTSRENPQLKQTYVMLSAFREGNVIKPVQFEVMQYVDDNNRLYLAVALTKIETSVMGNTILEENQASTTLVPISNISLTDLFSKINPKDRKFLKYVPNQFLNQEQMEAKNIALREDSIKYGKEIALKKYALFSKNTAPKKYGSYNVYGEDVMLQPSEDIAPVRDDVQPVKQSEAVTGDIAPTRESIAEKKQAAKENKFPMLDEEDIDPVKQNETVMETDVSETENKPAKRSELHSNIVDDIKTKFTEKGFDFDEVLKNAKNLSTFKTVDNIPQRVMEKALGYKEGQILADETVNKVAQNESAGIKWLNSFTDRKNGVLAQISKKYNIKPGSKESAAAQMYAEGFYVNEKKEIVKYGDRELTLDFPDSRIRENIKGLARDPQIRQIYDETLAAINASRARNLYPEIPRLDNYFLHFRAMDDTFSRLGLPFNPNDIKAKDLPTDLNGVTADLKPGQPYFASAKHREGKRTSFDLLGGLERYLTSAKNQIYHIDDIQTLRALRNYIADTYGQAKGLEGIDSLSEEEAQARIEQVYGAHLSTFAKFLNEEANVLAGKTSLIDRGLEGIIGRRGITFLNTVNGQVGSNMVGFNISSSLTNILPVVQTMAKTNKRDFIKALAQTASCKVNSIFRKEGDGFAEKSPVIIRRKGADRFYRTPYQKVGDTGYILMSAVDDVSTEIIARTKFNELTRKGMDSQQAHFETDKWVSRLMGDRSIGQMPQLYNSKMLGIVTKFQLEVRNQLDSMFYDTVQEAKVSNEEIENRLLKNARTAAKVGATFVQLAVLQNLFGKAFESVAGYNPAFDIIDVLIKTCGFDDDEEDEDTILDNIEEGFLTLLEDLPYTSTLTGGRIPISSALPITELIKGEDQYGNEKSRLEILGEIAPYYVLPTGYGQIKKTAQGIKMFDNDLPVSGSYTDSGNLRFPVDDTLGNRIQAGVFGQYASKNAQTYFDEDYAPLNEKQIQEYKELDLPIADYWKYREGLSGLETLNEKGDYIGGLDLPISKQNILINNIADRDKPIDMKDYDKYADFEEFDFASKNPEKYKVLKEHGISVKEYKEKHEKSAFMYTDDFSWAADNPEKYTLSKAVTDDVTKYKQYASDLYNIRADKDRNGKSISGSAKAKKKEYIWSLDIDEGAKYILFKSEYKADDTYNYEIVDYLNSRDDISYQDMKTILSELNFKVSEDGRITWD